MHRAHVQCDGCGESRDVGKEGWTAAQVEEKRCGRYTVVCRACVDQGLTPKDREWRTCKGCKTRKGRTKYSENALRKEPLVCKECVTKEADLVKKVRSGVKCTKNCQESVAHVEGCKAFRSYCGHPHVTREELQWLRALRECHRRWH